MDNIFGNYTEIPGGTHGLFSSSLLKSQIAGHLWDVKVCTVATSGGTTTYTPIAVDNGVGVKVLGFTHEDGGLQERYGKIAGVADKIGVTGSPAIVKDALLKSQEDETYFYHKPGQLAKVYEVEGDEFDPDIFGVGLHQFTNPTAVVEDAYVVVNGNGGWTAMTTKPSTSTYGFIGQVHSILKGMFYTIVNIATIQNKDVN